MLIRVIYVSTSAGPQTSTMTHSILKTAQAWNKANDITGVLCQGPGVFLQALEGERGSVTRLYSRICADQRHTDVKLIHCESIDRRRYEKWSMAHVSLQALDPGEKIEWPEFDPYSASGQLVMARIDELLASGTVIQNPES